MSDYKETALGMQVPRAFFSTYLKVYAWKIRMTNNNFIHLLQTSEFWQEDKNDRKE